MKGLAIRGGLVILALSALVWLAFGIQSVRLQDQADGVLARAQKGHVDNAEVTAALDDYDKARRLSPDDTPLLHKGQLLLAVGRQAAARKIALHAVADEPDSLQAWLYAFAVYQHDQLGKKTARAEILRLNPWFLWVLERRYPT